MPLMPLKWRRWSYGVGMAVVPLTQAFGWVDDNKAVALAGVLYAVFMGGLALRNARDPEA